MLISGLAYCLQWDLGFYSDDLLPTNRGYDSFYGSYLSYGDYLTHRAKDSVSLFSNNFCLERRTLIVLVKSQIAIVLQSTTIWLGSHKTSKG